MARPEKVQTVEEIRTRFNESDAALLTEYRGLGVKEISELRRTLRDAGTDYKVLKNTLARIAVRDLGMEDLVELLVGPTAIAFIKGDAVAAAKALDDAARAYPVLVIKGGVIGGSIIGADQAKALAKVEPREVQLAKIAMMMNTPLQQTVNVFAAMLRDLGSMLAQVVAKKESGELPGGPGEPEVVAAAEVAEASGEAAAAASEATPEETTPEAEAQAPEASGEEDPAEAGAEASEAVGEATSADPADAEASAATQAAQPADETTEKTAEGGEE